MHLTYLLYWSLIQDENLRFSLEDPARSFNCRKVLILRTCLQNPHFRPRKAAEVAVPPPTAPRPPHTLCGHRRRRDTFPRGSAERSAPPQLSGERRGAASGSFGESPTSCTAYRGEFSAPEAFVPHAARRDEVRAGGPNLGPPRSHRSPRH